MATLSESIRTSLDLLETVGESEMVKNLKAYTANIMFSDVWASYVEECHSERDGKDEDGNDIEHYGAGAQLDQVSPDYPPETMNLVNQLYALTEQLNGMSIEELVAKANECAGEDASKDFAYYIYMSAVGHGVSWTDNHPPCDIQVPSGEVYAWHGNTGWEIEGSFTARMPYTL